MPDKRHALRRRIAPGTPVEIAFSDGQGNFKKTYQLAFNLNVLAEISEKTGLSALDMAVWLKLDAKILRAMLWAALLPFHPEFDTRDAKTGARSDDGLEAVGSWLAGDNQDRVYDALWDAYLAYLPAERAKFWRVAMENAKAGAAAQEPAEEGADSPLDPSKSDGSSSGPSPAMTSESPKAKSAN
jgi:hypothetical protein